MTVTRDAYAAAELNVIGRPISKNNVSSLVVWMQSENTLALWNPEATEEPMPGDSDFNEQGVKNYPNIETGLAAFKKTIENGDYAAILDCLDRSAVPAETCSTIVNSPWGSKPTPDVVATVLTDFSTYAAIPIPGSEDTAEPTEPSQPQPTEGDNVNAPTLQEGSEGKPVVSVQAILNAQAGAKLAEDGDFGPSTKDAVIAWQQFFGLTTDGIVGPLTWTTLVNF